MTLTITINKLQDLCCDDTLRNVDSYLSVALSRALIIVLSSAASDENETEHHAYRHFFKKGRGQNKITPGTVNHLHKVKEEI